MYRSPGATLLELLVVVSVIALLAAIVIPTAMNAKRATKRVLCLQNFRSLSMALTLYADENRGLLPPTAQRAVRPERPDLAVNIIRADSVMFDLASMLGPYVAPAALNCTEARELAYSRSRIDAETVYSNYLFAGGAISGTPEEGYRRIDDAPPRGLAAADLTWNIFRDGELLFAGNHLKSGQSWHRPQPFVLGGQRDRTGTQYLLPSIQPLAGLNAAFFDGSAQWVRRRRGAWRDAGPFHQGAYRAARVYLPARR